MNDEQIIKREYIYVFIQIWFKSENFENWAPINDDLIYSIGIEFNDDDDEYDSYDAYLDVLENTYQWYMVSHRDASLLNDFNQVVIYNDDLNVYLWCIGHYGTSWDYVLTDIKIESV